MPSRSSRLSLSSLPSLPRPVLAVWVVLVLLVLAACGGEEPQVIVVTATPEPAGATDDTGAEPDDGTGQSGEAQQEPTAPEPTQPPADGDSGDGGVAVEPTTDSAAGAVTGVLQTVLERGTLVCGVNGALPGFSLCASDQECSGFDADFCRVVAAAVFGDAEAVEFRSLSAEERFDAVRSGEVDVLFRNTTWTASRDSELEQLDFGPTTFHDGQGFMVRKALNVTTVPELEGRTICVQSGTTSEANLSDQLAARDITFTPLVFDNIDETYAAYDSGECDAVSSDRSQLAAKRTELENPGEHFILGRLISREPLGPVFVENDSAWRDVVSWAVFATIRSEELGVSSVNAADMATATDDPNVRLLLGREGTLGADLGIDEDFALNIIEQVGNYEEIYNRNLGPDTPLDLDRGPNKAWNKGQGGVLSAPPFR